jgi:ribonuclease HII
MPQFANFAFESALLRDKYDYIIAIDEVGRGAIAGPVVVGATVVDATLEATMPEGIRDSKLIPEKQRAGYLERASQWVLGGAVGRVDASEVDSFGITHSLASAASRAISQLEDIIPEIKSSRTIILLDGSHNWLESLNLPYFTITKVKADLECASVSAASILAKVYRDKVMVEKSAEINDIYHWTSNKGYGAKSHYEAIAEHGVLEGWHRVTWINK